ncbi:MAG: hypothetical protein KAX42_12015 [Sphaerotilus sp.]|nr:hypothetical protein [Sphaerotilus sp.]
MMVFRVLLFFLLVSGLLSFGLYLATGQSVWRRRAIAIIRWTVIAGLAFFCVLLLERLALAL